MNTYIYIYITKADDYEEKKRSILSIVQLVDRFQN